jgi:hypothetical protein
MDKKRVLNIMIDIGTSHFLAVLVICVRFTPFCDLCSNFAC